MLAGRATFVRTVCSDRGDEVRGPQDGDSSGPDAKVEHVALADVIDGVLEEVPVPTVWEPPATARDPVVPLGPDRSRPSIPAARRMFRP